MYPKRVKYELQEYEKIISIRAVLQGLRIIIDEDPLNEVTYRKVLYAKELQRELSKLIANPDSSVDMEDELQSLMYYLNYNSGEAFTYRKQYIDLVLSEVETGTEQIEKLSYIRKRINQAR